MPNRLAHWDVRTRTGNPTKSAELNDLIKMIKKKEVRKQGSESKARRPLELSELREMVRRCRKSDESFVKFTSSAFFLFQFHMIARLDDVAKFHYRDLKPHVKFDFA